MLSGARLRLALVVLLSAVFWGSLYGLFIEGFLFLESIHAEVISLLFNAFFSSLMIMLLFSTAILLYGNMYCSPEARLLLTLPVRAEAIFSHKFHEAMWFSSWGFILLGSPMLVAYGVVRGSPWTYYLLLLPFMEENQVYGRLRMDEAFAAQAVKQAWSSGAPLAGGTADNNAAVAGTIIPGFFCPSDTGTKVLTGEGAAYGPASGQACAKTNYDFSIMKGDFTACKYWAFIKSPGIYSPDRLQLTIFGEDNTTRVQNVTDGLSKTALLSEQTLQVNSARCSFWSYRAWYGPGISVDHANGINSFVAGKRGTSLGSNQPGSLHTKGVNLVLADASVRFVNEETAQSILQSLSRMADGGVSNMDF